MLCWSWSDEKDIQIDLKCDPEEPIEGESFTLVAKIKNLTKDEIRLELNAELHTLFYTGVRRHFIKNKNFETYLTENQDYAEKTEWYICWDTLMLCHFLGLKRNIR